MFPVAALGVNASTSCPDEKLVVMDTVALESVVLSTSATVMPLLIVSADPFSVNPTVLPPAPSVGASLAGATVTVERTFRAVVSTPPLAVPPLSCREVSVTARAPAVGFSLVLR